MVVMGVDLHKRSHTVVVIDETGRKLAEKTIAATDAGHLELLRWAGAWPSGAGPSRTAATCPGGRRRAPARRRAGRPGPAQADGRNPPVGP